MDINSNNFIEFVKRHLSKNGNSNEWNTKIDRMNNIGLLSPEIYQKLKTIINNTGKIEGERYIMEDIVKGICHSCYFRHRCCHHCLPQDDNCKYWKLGKCYTCKFVDDDENAWLARGCEAECFGGCKKYKRDWNKTFELLKIKFFRK